MRWRDGRRTTGMGGKTAAYLVLASVSIFPSDWNKPNRDRVEKLSFVKRVGDPGHRVGVGCELHALKQDGPATDQPHFGHERLAQSEDDVPVLVGVLENRVASVRLEPPARSGNDFVGAVQRFVARDEIENGLRVGRALTPNPSPVGWARGTRT